MKMHGQYQVNSNTYGLRKIVSNILILFLMFLLALWLKSLVIETSRQQAGIINFSLGFTLLIAYVGALVLKKTGLPMISGYIFAGIVAGPFVTGFLTKEMVLQFRLIDDLALSFIALTAGGELHLSSLETRGRAIMLNILMLTLIVFGLVFLFVNIFSGYFGFTRNLPGTHVAALAILLGVVAVARSPSSAIAIISECKASGTFTETVLGVTVAMDILVIIFFTLALTVARVIMAGTGMEFTALAALSLEIAGSIFLGFIIGKCISSYIEKAGHDLSLFLLCLAFATTKASLWLDGFMDERFDFHLHLEPLLICMSAGFTVQNFGKHGAFFMESLERTALPIYVLFFCLAGAGLNLDALYLCWPLALSLALVRVAGIFCATWLAGTIIRDKPSHKNNAWLAYLTQAGVAIGLAQLAQRQFPEIGVQLTTIVLAVITINQVVGPITFKIALGRVGEVGKL